MPSEDLFSKRRASFSNKRMRNLKQYKDLSDDEFNEVMDNKREEVVDTSADYEVRIEDKLKQFEEDYDLSDLKINDKEILRALVQAILSLEDYEQEVYKFRSMGITANNLEAIETITKTMTQLRGDISKMQDDLKITRKIRKSDQEASVIAYIDSLKQKAKEFYEAKMQYIFCPNCNMLLATVWTLYPTEDNILKLVCKRELSDGNICNTSFTVNTKELLENKGTNKPEIMPDSM